MTSHLDFFYGKRVLITGMSGFKGAWLGSFLNYLGADVMGFYNDVPTNPSLFDAAGLTNDINVCVGDICDLSLLTSLVEGFRPEFVFHLAAQSIVKHSYEDPIETYRVNTLGSLYLLRAISKLTSKTTVVMITSDKCYENREWVYGYRELDEMGGADPYSASKACAEIAISSYWRSFLRHKSNCRVATARAGNVIGGGDWAKYRLIPDCARSWLDEQAVEIRNPAGTRPWQHVLEPLNGYLMLAEALYRNEQLDGESFNIGPSGDHCFPVATILEDLSKIWFGFRYAIGQTEDNFKEAGLLQLNCDKARSLLGWRPVLEAKQGIAWTADWYAHTRIYPGQEKAKTLEQIKTFCELIGHSS